MLAFSHFGIALWSGYAPNRAAPTGHPALVALRYVTEHGQIRRFLSVHLEIAVIWRHFPGAFSSY
jgi:hypothetical protein